ncbi:hypothetical protein [Leptothermofonsia sp. ETS-13]|uniref:hypothetical protein n=1 Tax=Leptothermofonsia sp. ETS-13 TaxID=3035696 RepID=UPI003B9E84AA
MLMQASRTICFPEGTTAIARLHETTEHLDLLLCELGLKGPCPVIVLVGGANGLRHYHIARLHTLFVHVLAPLAESLGAVVLDGGTDTGVMRMMGNAHRQIKSTFPLIGVLPAGLATLPGELPPFPDAAPLEPNHTHFMLVPGSCWGDECIWLSKIASVLCQGAPSMTVLVNGGEITWKDALESVRANRTIVAIAGSGRAADTLAMALQGEDLDHRAQEIVASGLLQAADLKDTEGLASIIRQTLYR